MDYQNTVMEALLNDNICKQDPRIQGLKDNMEKVIRTDILSAFFEAIPEHNIKLDIKTLIQSKKQNNFRKNKMIVPFNAFFYPYTIDVENYSVEIFELMGNNAVVTKMITEYGDFWLVAIVVENTNSVHVNNDEDIYDDGIPRQSLQCTLYSEVCRKKGVQDNSVIIFARIDPYICVNCGAHAPGMNKCKGCWDNLKMCVRYCSKECQKEDYVKRHRHYCGCKTGTDRSRRLEFEARSVPCKKMTLDSLHESAKS